MTSHFYLQQAKLRSKQEKAKGSAFAKSAGLSDRRAEGAEAKGLDKVKTGELNSAYSMQQVTANVLVGKQAYNKRLLKKYSKRARRQLKLQGSKRRGDKAMWARTTACGCSRRRARRSRCATCSATRAGWRRRSCTSTRRLDVGVTSKTMQYC